MEAAVFMGLLTGSLTSNYIFEVTSTQFMFVLSTGLIAMALIYIKFAVTESVIGATENDERTLVRPISTCMFGFLLLTLVLIFDF